jgi:hypothetical protein
VHIADIGEALGAESSSAISDGAMQMLVDLPIRTEVISGGPSAASDGGARTRLAAPANETVVRNRRRV